MPSQQAETPPKKSRGSRRRPRKSPNTTTSHISSVQDNTDSSLDPGHSRESNQPIRILSRNDYNVVPDVRVVGNLELPNPTTPPRSSSVYDEFSYAQYQGNQSAPDSDQRTKKGRKSHGGITRASGVVRPEPNQASIPVLPQQPHTPKRSNETPVKAYAGPTFHASPAASSLPIPKFISRSVPNVDRALSLSSMMEQEAADSTSESEQSPFLASSRSTQDHQVRDDSPLDIFFRADRDAKAKAQAQVQVQVESPASFNGLRSGSQNDVRHHSRQPTDSSVGGLFPLEMDGAAAETPPSTINNERSTPVAKAMPEIDDRDQQRKAQTLELKKLLYSPKPRRSASSSPSSGTLSRGLGSPSPKATPRGGSPKLDPDSTSKDQQRHAVLLALAQKQISGPGINIGLAPQRPPSSKLREEVSVPSSPGVQPPELPATPTQTRVQKTFTNERTGQYQNSYPSPYPSFSSAFTPPPKPPDGFQNTHSRHSTDAKSIEQDLRRILKLDVLGGDDVTGVPS